MLLHKSVHITATTHTKSSHSGFFCLSVLQDDRTSTFDRCKTARLVNQLSFLEFEKELFAPVLWKQRMDAGLLH